MTGRDVHDLNGKFASPEARYDVVVVGAGTAGTAAALAAAQSGRTVLLVDENPVAGAMIGSDVPYLFGGRATSAVQNSARMVEQLFATNAALEAVFDAGVEVRLGTCAWGLYQPGPALRTLPEPMLGLADGDRAWMVGYGELILATGARDIVLGFAGWDRPGVIGAQGCHLLLTRYDALATRRLVVLGSGRLALETALLAQARGIEVAAVVEVLGAVQGPAALADRVRAGGASFHLGSAIVATSSGIDGITGMTLADGTIIACDTICLALGVTPATELLDAASGSATRVGDAAGPLPDMTYIAAWSRALGRYAGPDTVVCQCEDVTRADLLGVQPPRYLDRPAAQAARSLGSLAADGPAHPDQIKRLTRAGMGLCQGRRCRTQVACLLAEATGVAVTEVPVASFRAPVRPVPLALLADWHELPAIAAGWDVWFGIPTQWTPYADIGTAREAGLVADGGNRHV